MMTSEEIKEQELAARRAITKLIRHYDELKITLDQECLTRAADEIGRKAAALDAVRTELDRINNG